MGSGKLNRNKKFCLNVRTNDSRLFMSGRGQAVPEIVKEYSFGYKRKKQLGKMIIQDILANKWISHKDFFDFILGEGLVHKIELLALISTFNRSEYLENKKLGGKPNGSK